MLKVGLTGGIGSGKSEVARLFEALGAPVIDTDIIARQLTQSPGVLAEIRDAFGPGVIDPGGCLDRSRLAEVVFSDRTGKQRLEAILHPRIRAEVFRQLDDCGDRPYAIIVVPLLLETDFHTLVDRVLVVDASPDRQLARVGERDGRSEESIKAIMRNQLTREERLARADDVIDNNSDISYLERQVAALHQQYAKTAK